MTAAAPTFGYQLRKLARRNKKYARAAAVVAGLLAASATFASLQAFKATRERNRAETAHAAALLAQQQEIAAKQRELDQSVRADTVTDFIDSLLSDVVPELIRQGNMQGAREMLDTADRLATSSLSNAPAAEVELRFRLSWILSFPLNDYGASLRQAEFIPGLLSRVSDNQLEQPRELLRLRVSAARLLAAGGQGPAVKKAMRELDDLYAEFMERTPPAKRWASICRLGQALWFWRFQKLDLAEDRLAEAYELVPKDGTENEHVFWIAGRYAGVLVELGKLARAEQVVTESLRLPPQADEDTRITYLDLVQTWHDILCRQNRFEEVVRMIEDQRRVLTDGGGSEADLLRLDRLRGATLARSGNAEEALGLLLNVAANPHSDADDWSNAAFLAVATGNLQTHRELCRTGVLRFASTAQGLTAVAIAAGLLASPTDEMTLSLARGLVERLPKATDWSREFATLYESVIALRERRHAEALDLLDAFFAEPSVGFGRVTVDSYPVYHARYSFIRALLCAELDRAEEARRGFNEGRANLRKVIGNKPGDDRSGLWILAYRAESWQREAEAAFKANGIPLPEGTAE